MIQEDTACIEWPVSLGGLYRVYVVSKYEGGSSTKREGS